MERKEKQRGIKGTYGNRGVKYQPQTPELLSHLKYLRRQGDLIINKEPILSCIIVAVLSRGFSRLSNPILPLSDRRSCRFTFNRLFSLMLLNTMGEIQMHRSSDQQIVGDFRSNLGESPFWFKSFTRWKHVSPGERNKQGWFAI